MNSDWMVLPDYAGGGITNLMSSLGQALSDKPQPYPPLSLMPPDELAAFDNLVLWVIDGLGYHQLQQQLPDGALASHCRGAITSVCPSTTAAAIPTFFTGVAPLQHGLTGWFTYFAEYAGVLTVLPFSFRLGQVPLPNSITPADLSGSRSLFDGLSVSGNVVMPAWIAHSRFNQAFSGAAKVRPFSDLAGLQRATRNSVRTKLPSYTYTYWAEYDAICHHYGWDSPQALAELQRLDRAFEKLLDQLAGSNTRLIITADHGFMDSPEDHSLELQDHPRLADCLALPLCGEPRLAFCYVHADRIEQFESYVHQDLGHCCQLVTRQQMLEQGWFGAGKPHPRVADRIGHYALVMKDDYKITGALPGERRLHHVGVHGGLSRQEMMVPLVVADL